MYLSIYPTAKVISITGGQNIKHGERKSFLLLMPIYKKNDRNEQ
jgi:hypothetical protein